MIEQFIQETLSLPQLLGWLGLIFMVSAYQFKQAKSIRLIVALATAFFVLHFYLMEGYVGMIIAIASTLRGFILSIDRAMVHKRAIVIFNLLVVYTVVLSSGVMKEWYDILPLFGTAMACLQDMQTKANHMRAVSLIREVFWLVYFTFLMSHGGVVHTLLTIVSSLIALIRYRKKQDD